MSVTQQDKRLSVVWLCLEWPGKEHRGGVARYAYRLARELAPLVSLTIVTETGGDPLPGARMVYVPASTSRLSRYYGQALRLRRVVRRLGDVDVVHSFGDDWALGRGPWRRVRHFLGLSLSEARSSRGLRRLNHYVLAALEKYSQWRADYRIAIGPESYEAFRCEAIMPPVVAVPNVDVAKTADPTVVFVGSHGGRKRGHLAEEAVEKVRAATGRPVQLIVFGPEEDAARWSPLTVHRAGASDDEVHTAIAAAWALLSPSEYEGFGIPIFEASALGTAVIATPNPGSRYQADVLTERSGLVLVDSPDELAAALESRLDAGPELSATQQEAGRAGVSALLADASVARLIDEAYR